MPHPFYNFFVGLAGSGLAQGGPGAKESALAPELGRGRAEPGRGITILDYCTNMTMTSHHASQRSSKEVK